MKSSEAMILTAMNTILAIAQRNLKKTSFDFIRLSKVQYMIHDVYHFVQTTVLFSGCAAKCLLPSNWS